MSLKDGEDVEFDHKWWTSMLSNLPTNVGFAEKVKCKMKDGKGPIYPKVFIITPLVSQWNVAFDISDIKNITSKNN